ncbi:hypothetical protein [Flavobacterium sp. JP2137]|uniref:hypothetical protein n=1 Tax=Flavobacterium sp. JP2137 TaxID=3414510 RepID=UPI003D2FD856
MKSKIKLMSGRTILSIAGVMGLFLAGSCNTDDLIEKEKEVLIQTDPPIVLDCNYFSENRVLTKNPNAAVDYIIKCVMPIRTADIRVEPGVVIEFEQDAGIDIYSTSGQASFAAIGTSDKPVILRGAKKEKGYWRGIMYNSHSPQNILEHTRVADAGGKQFNSNGDMGAVHLYAKAQLSIKNCEITNSKTYGLNAVYKGSDLSLEHTRFKNNDIPVILAPEYLNAITNSNDYSGNTKDYVVVESGSFAIETSWQKINVPYQILNKSAYGYSGGIDVKNILTIEPGVVLEFDAGTKLKLVENSGAIKAVGTAQAPIVFTAINKVKNGWIGIYFVSKHPVNKIAFAEFHYSGKTTGTGESESGTIRLLPNNVLEIHDVTFKNINGCAIRYGLNAGQSENTLFTYSNLNGDNQTCLVSCFGHGCA